MIFRLIMSVLGEASAGMRWAGTLPRMACSRAASVATFGCARCCGERNCAFCRTWNWERGLFSEPVVSEVILARSGWLAST